MVRQITNLVPDYMVMGERGMADMGEMEMPLPDNTLPMMTGQGQFGAIEMGGMFTVVKVREGLSSGDYKDPGWYRHPPGTVAYEVSEPANAPRQGSLETGTESGSGASAAEVRVVKPGTGRGRHSGH